MNWIGVPSLDDALGRIKDAARTMKPGAWLIVAGGWNVQQFKENRRPTQAELVAAAPDNPVYVQLGTLGDADADRRSRRSASPAKRTCRRADASSGMRAAS